MAITVEIEGMNELLAAYGNIERGLLDFRQIGAWKGVQIEFYKVLKEVFATAGGSTKGGKWAPLSTKYAAAKLKRYHGPTQILRASGALYKSLTSSGATGSVYNATAQELEIGTSIEYAGYHQTGTKAPSKRGGVKKGFTGPLRGGMPARPILDFTDAQEKQLMKPIQTKLKQLIENARLRNIRGF